MAGVQGGRPLERKARHNKVYTAKGPRDRRVRLSANTAIQFYDVQDRLGYDRASEAVDWLINKAKASIDKLFDTSSSQHNAQLDYDEDMSILEKQQFNFADNSEHISEYNSMDRSMLFPYVNAGNVPQEFGSVSHNQEGCAKGQIQRMLMFNSTFLECPRSEDQATGIQNSGVSSDENEIVKFYISSQGHGHQENQTGFLMPNSYHV